MIFSSKNLSLCHRLFITKIFMHLAFILLIFTITIDAKIPEYKGLYTLFSPEFTTDTIGIGQSLRYSNWLENVYTYAPKDNAARQVIATLLFKRLEDENKNFVKENNFGPSIKHPVSSSLKAKDFGKLIKYIREFNKNNEDGTKKSTEQLDAERNNLKLKYGGNKNKEKIIKFIKSLEELKFNDKFIPEMAECILWAFFDRKEDWGEKEFKECLAEINKDYWHKLQDQRIQESFYTIDETTDKAIIENIAKNL